MSVEMLFTPNVSSSVRLVITYHASLLNEFPGAMTARPLTCVWCRAKWVVAENLASSSTGAGVGSNEGYLNLGIVAGVGPVRDTSSCMYRSHRPNLSHITDSYSHPDYHGPRRGQKGWGRGSYY